MKHEITKDNIREKFLERYYSFPYIGILWAIPNLKKTFIVKNEKGESIGIYHKDLSLKSKWAKSNNYEYCEEVFHKNSKNKVYMFDTAEELFEWLINANAM